MQRNKGFTLIELLVVIAIIGFLSSITLAALSVTRSKARDARRKTDMNQLSMAINLYYQNNEYLPRNTNGWCTSISNTNSNWGPSFQADISPTYISPVPLDPTLANKLGDYFYANQNNKEGRFTLCSIMENATGKSYGAFDNCAGWTSEYNYCISN